MRAPARVRFAPAPLLALAVLAGCADPRAPRTVDDAGAVGRWSALALEAVRLDHTPAAAGDPRRFGEQPGPARTSRALAIVHVAMFEAANAAAAGRYRSAIGLAPEPRAVSVRVAVARAAHDTLGALYPSQAAELAARLAAEEAEVPDRALQGLGSLLGVRAAAAVLAWRAADGAAHAEPVIGVDYHPSALPGRWRMDPVSRLTVALGARWGEVAPFAIGSVEPFRAPPPPPLDGPEYAEAFAEVKRFGGDGVSTPTVRTADQSAMGLYWAYDGTAALGTPPRLYNQIAAQIAQQQGTRGVELARLLALVNVAMADAGIAIWESKYRYDVWRPVTAIREADPGTGPTGAGDGNPWTQGDVAWTPMGAPASNGRGPNFTPPFPAYPSGHAGFGGALFQVLRRYYGRDDIAFTFVSDEMNGVTRDVTGAVRPMAPRTFDSLTEAEQENGQSRIYLGIHWSFDMTAGIDQGRRVADFVFDHAFRPR